MKRFLSLFLSILLVLTTVIVLPASAESNEHSFETREFAFVFGSMDVPQGAMALTFVDGVEDVPYIGIEPLVTLLGATMGDAVMLDHTYTDGVLDIFRTDMDFPYWCEIDYKNGVISFEDYDAFFKQPDQSTILDLVGYLPAPYIYRPSDLSFERFGKALELPVTANYGIPFYVGEEDAYLPLQTVSDLFLSKLHSYVAFNGSYLFWNLVPVDNEGSYTPADILYRESATTAPRSEVLKDLNYRELCLALDTLYGLKEEHRITAFSSLFLETGLTASFYSDDSLDTSNAIYELMDGYLADSHSGIMQISFRTDPEAFRTTPVTNTSFSGSWLTKDKKRFLSARKTYFPDDDCPFYCEVGDTAYVTFDEFIMTGENYYADPGDVLAGYDTFAVVIYANSQIKRENSPIRNVVLDLSCNLGGSVNAAVYLIGWFLGPSVLHSYSDITGAQASTIYRSDVNLDENYTDEDTLIGYNRYCLISPATFSAANLTAALFKIDSGVTLLGKPSGGGGCCVLPITTMNGDVLNISAPIGLMTLKNGSYYQVDRGVEPDFAIDKISSYYDREQLTERIHNLDING